MQRALIATLYLWATIILLWAVPCACWAIDPNDQPDEPFPTEPSPSPTAPASPAASPAPQASPSPTVSPSPHGSPSPSPSPQLNRPPTEKGFLFPVDVRVQPEYYDFFKSDNTHVNDYAFLGVRSRGSVEYNATGWNARAELQDVWMVALPPNANAPSPAGSLGQGGSYFSVARRESLNTLGLRQLYFRVGAPTGALGTPTGSALKIGRFEYSSGLEAPSLDPVLNWLKRERLAKKLIGGPDYNIFSRTYDGARWDVDSEPVRLTAFVAHPTQAEPHFAVDVHSVFTSNVAVTFKQGGWLPNSEAQIFWNHLDDNRNVPQVDDRPSAERKSIQEEGGDHIDTFGMHYLTHLGRDGDALVWLAHQTGKWGAETQDANAMAAELGLRFPQIPWQPWLRIGYGIYSGDNDPTHTHHGTFWAEDADPRVRYNMFTFPNMHDLDAQIILLPGPSTRFRLDIHAFRLDSARDLWYSGSGIQQQSGLNGISGRPSGGFKDLGTMLEMWLLQKIDEHNNIQLRYVPAFGGRVVHATYPVQDNGNLFFIEYHYVR